MLGIWIFGDSLCGLNYTSLIKSKNINYFFQSLAVAEYWVLRSFWSFRSFTRTILHFFVASKSIKIFRIMPPSRTIIIYSTTNFLSLSNTQRTVQAFNLPCSTVHVHWICAAHLPLSVHSQRAEVEPLRCFHAKVESFLHNLLTPTRLAAPREPTHTHTELGASEC